MYVELMYVELMDVELMYVDQDGCTRPHPLLHRGGKLATWHIGSSWDLYMTTSNDLSAEDAGQPSGQKKAILHICEREILRPLRDQILRLSGFHVESTCTYDEGFAFFHSRPFHLVLVDVEGETGILEAERFCSEIKTSHHGQLVAFVCNWRVASLTDCPDEVLRTEFDPAAFVAGVRTILTSN